jgi:hypothetical protein
MKKHYWFYCLLIFVFSCNKEETIKEYQIKNDSNIITFLKNYEMYKRGIVLKEGDSVTIDSVKNCIDEVFNYTYSYPPIKSATTEWDNFNIDIPLSNNGSHVRTSDLYTAYDQIISGVRSIYRNIQNKDKRVVGLVVEIAYLGNGYLTLRLTSQILIGLPTGNYNDKWYARDSWTCDYSLTGLGYGAANTMEADVNFKYNPAPPPGYRVVVSSLTTVTWDVNSNPSAYRNPDPNDPIDNFEDYIFYYTTSAVTPWSTSMGCVEGYTQPGSEMTYYQDQLDSYIYTYQTNHSPYKCYNCYITSMSTTIPNTIFWHVINMTFAKKKLVPISTYPIAID